MRTLLVALASSFLLALPVQAQELSISPSDSLQSVLTAQIGKRVTLRLSGGQELTGTLCETTGKLVALDALSGREFFDAVIPLEKIEAVLIRTK